MRPMVLDEVGAHAATTRDASRAQAPGEPGHFYCVLRPRRGAAPVAWAAEHARDLRPEVGARIPRDGDVFQRGWVRPFEACLRRERWESCPVLNAVKAFLLERECQMPIDE